MCVYVCVCVCAGVNLQQHKEDGDQGADCHDVDDKHWINGYPTPIAHPMSSYPLYKDKRKSWGINGLLANREEEKKGQGKEGEEEKEKRGEELALLPQVHTNTHAHMPLLVAALGSLVVEVESDDGQVGVGVSIGGDPACFIVENHLSRFIEGQDPRDVELIWDQMYRYASRVCVLCCAVPCCVPNLLFPPSPSYPSAAVRQSTTGARGCPCRPSVLSTSPSGTCWARSARSPCMRCWAGRQRIAFLFTCTRVHSGTMDAARGRMRTCHLLLLCLSSFSF